MRISDALANVSRLFLDTAPVIYFVERNPQFVDLVDPIFERLSADITAVVSGITLSECLVGAIRLGLADLEQAFVDVLQQEEVVFVEINAAIAREAARIRVHYNLQLPDALQVAAALIAGCQAFLTNDAALKRVTELRVLVMCELESENP
ncbi:type II toxin-antitoxin system VapC family toxin [Nostoc sp. UHCC 0702]|nr:type II toxin-antitoxin system VapC family toxin [Nostoc sp. UHCC 0702]